MFIKFEEGRSYIWLFPLVAGASFLLAFNGGIWLAIYDQPGAGFTACLGFLLPLYWLKIAELRSGVALNRMWRAVYPKGTAAFTLNIVGGLAILTIFLGVIVHATFFRT